VKFTLRDYKPEDFGTLYEIDRACYPMDIAYSKRELRAYLQMLARNASWRQRPIR